MVKIYPVQKLLQIYLLLNICNRNITLIDNFSLGHMFSNFAQTNFVKKH